MTLPAVPEPFYWIDAPWGHALRCRALDGVATHLFSTRQLELSSDTHAAALTASLGALRLVQVNQVHGRAHVVVRAGAPLAAGDRPEADILVSNAAEAAVAVRAADCVPILLADRKTGAVAAVHAGWRGTCAGAAGAAVGALRAEFGSRPDDLVAAIGPSIGVCCYEVGPGARGRVRGRRLRTPPDRSLVHVHAAAARIAGAEPAPPRRGGRQPRSAAACGRARGAGVPVWTLHGHAPDDAERPYRPRRGRQDDWSRAIRRAV
jgi:YfiH family protein